MTRIVLLLSLGALVLDGCAFMQSPTPSARDDSGALQSAEASGESVRPGQADATDLTRTPEPDGSPAAAATSEGDRTPGTAASPATASPRPAFTAEPLLPSSSSEAVVTGMLAFDSVEGGCGYLETTNGTRYQVIYPTGWQIDGGTGHLHGPRGEDAPPGSQVSVRGSIVTDMASTCQVGPMFRAVEVIRAGD